MGKGKGIAWDKQAKRRCNTMSLDQFEKTRRAVGASESVALERKIPDEATRQGCRLIDLHERGWYGRS